MRWGFERWKYSHWWGARAIFQIRKLGSKTMKVQRWNSDRLYPGQGGEQGQRKLSHHSGLHVSGLPGTGSATLDGHSELQSNPPVLKDHQWPVPSQACKASAGHRGAMMGAWRGG